MDIVLPESLWGWYDGRTQVTLPSRTFGPGERRSWLRPPATVRWRREKLPDVTDMVEIRCGERQRHYVTVSEPTMAEYSAGATGRALHIPDTRWMLVTAEWSWGTEGDYGSGVEAALFDLDRCEPAAVLPAQAG